MVVAVRADDAGATTGLAVGQRRPVQAVGRGASRTLLGADRGLLGDRRDGDGLLQHLAGGLHTVDDGDPVAGDLLAHGARGR